MLCASGLFLGVTRSSCPFFMFCAPELSTGGTAGVMYHFKFCATELVFDDTEGVGARFHVLRYQTLFGRYRGRRGLFLSFALSDTFLAVPRESGPVFMFCAPRLVFDSTEVIQARFHVLRYRTLMGVTECAGIRFHVLFSQTSFGRYRGRRLPFSSFSLLDSFSMVPKASGLVFMFCTPGLVSGGTAGVGYRFQVLRSHTRFQWYQGRRGLFSCFEVQTLFGRYRDRRDLFSSFALPDSF
jgi:hypothetical protein